MTRRSAVDPLVQIRRSPARAAYDEETVASILDAGSLCHVGVVRAGRPVVVPTLYARDGDRLVLHGSPLAGMFRAMDGGVPVCVTVTHLDGVVLARSVFHHSMNYRSVAVHGVAVAVLEEAAKLDSLRILVEHIAAGQWDYARRPSEPELRQTSVWSLPLDLASAKVRVGGPVDEPEDLSLPVWAGVLPLSLGPGQLVADPALPAGLDVPAHLRDLAGL